MKSKARRYIEWQFCDIMRCYKKNNKYTTQEYIRETRIVLRYMLFVRHISEENFNRLQKLLSTIEYKLYTSKI